LPHDQRRSLIDASDPALSLSRQANLLGVGRSTLYYVPYVNPRDLVLMNEIDEIYTKCPFYGKRKIRIELINRGYPIGVKHTCSLMKKMGIQAICPKPGTSIPNKEHAIYPYLLGDLQIYYPNQVWGTDITYIRIQGGFIYLVAIIDWYSRYVVSWRLSNSMETDFCIQALEEGLMNQAKPHIFNSDQGSQFTSNAFTKVLKDHEVKISMDGRGRCMDNIFTERLWRSVKYEEVYLKDYVSLPEARQSLTQYFHFYNYERSHQSLNYLTPAKFYYDHPYS
jgi:putative transposase